MARELGGKLRLMYLELSVYIAIARQFRQWGVNGKKIIGLDELKKIYGDYEVIITPSTPDVAIDIGILLTQQKIPFRHLSQIMRTGYGTFYDDDVRKYKEMCLRPSFAYAKEYEHPQLGGRGSSACNLGGGLGRYYFWQDIWGARKVHDRGPALHYDIGSRVDGFILALLAQRQKTCLIDIRPLDIPMPEDLSFIQADATNLEGIENESIESLSALCSLEHFGLGQYGDPIDPEGCFKVFDAVQRKMKRGGHIYISVPIGQDCVVFNAHRVFFAETIVNSFDKCLLEEFSGADEEGNFITGIDLHRYDQTPKGEYAIAGLFEFVKK